MNCENEFCIYEEKGKCTLDDVNHDINGACTECILIDIEEGLLIDLKKQLLEKIASEYDENGNYVG